MAQNSTSNKERPLAGVVLCFTSILPEQRTELATIASQMGAAHKFDLTSDVTHLLVGEINTAKYKFVARERSDVVVLRPEWVEAVRQSWMQGEDTDIRALEQQYRLPTFMGLAICITGFEDMAYRNYIQDTAVAHGADFRKDLTKSVTHLIARNTEGQKYKFATQWNIKVVTMKWFTDSIERGMVLEETLYHPLLLQEQQGVGAWNRTVPPAKEKAVEAESSSNPRPRKLRRIASTKLVDQNEGIWGAIVGAGFENNELRRSTNSQPKNEDVPFSKITRKASVVQEAKSFASETTFAEAQGSRQDTSEVRPASNNGFLDGCFFFIYGFSPKQTSVLRHHLSYNGAQLVSSLSEFSRPEIPKRGHGLYTIVSYKTPRSEIPSTDDLAFECDVVTDMWLERCLEAKALVPPESYIACTPLPVFPIPGFHGMKICSTGFSRIDLLHLSKLIDLIGATYDEYLTPKASVLVCNDSRSMNNEKLRHTSEWKIPAVTIDWLWSSIRSAQRKAFEPYIIQRLSQPEKSLEVRAGSRTEQKQLSKSFDKPNRTAQPDSHTTESKRLGENGPTKSTPVEKPSKLGSEDESVKPPLPYKRPSQSASVSPTKVTGPTNTASPSNKRKASDHGTTPAQSAIELAVSGFLKQARAANSRSKSDTADQESDSLRRRRRKPLLGRAPSHSSAQGVFSRASSIDTLNEDGCGSAVESINTEGFNSFLTGGRFEPSESQRRVEDEENEEPAMTQLNYEDPDAVKMREELFSHAGKLSKKKSPDQGVIVGEVRELEDVGWGTGRRTRNAVKDSEDEL
ncbi:S-M checkpoint control protein rad4 [Aspergillus lentulus]|uniref:S-M checkpoint control protein rad4 n=1 Tax=Aspergillus lentulus TaxID=293939 RepID=A0AAN4PNF5_ASPLE|nr:S-M checkpoint control protein rad4 [Aspergillus lentulus]GFF65502.1 S-M checkpoint control protein rad4 [Aspergillus lentulus]